MDRDALVKQLHDICAEYTDILGRVILFGSFSRNEYDEHSDVDLYIEPRDESMTTTVFDMNKRYLSFCKKMYASIPREFDFLAFGGKRDIKRLKKSRLWRQIEKDGVVIYDKGAEAV